MSGDVLNLGDCLLCDEPIAVGERFVEMPSGYMSEGTIAWRRARVHVECQLRSVTGGIGHLTDHAFWCLKVGDPNGGQSYRRSALAVVEWIARHGFPSTADRHDDEAES